MRKDRAMPPNGERFAFDPVAVGRSEYLAWVAYYRRDWLRMLAGALGMVRHGFALGPLRNLKAAWHVMRAASTTRFLPANGWRWLPLLRRYAKHAIVRRCELLKSYQ